MGREMFTPKTIHSFYRRPKTTALLDWTPEADILGPGKLKFLINSCARAGDDVINATFGSCFLTQSKKFYFPGQI